MFRLRVTKLNKNLLLILGCTLLQYFETHVQEENQAQISMAHHLHAVATRMESVSLVTTAISVRDLMIQYAVRQVSFQINLFKSYKRSLFM